MTWSTHTTAQLISDGILEIGDGYRAKNSEMGETGLPFVRAGNVDGRINTEEADLLSPESVAKVGRKRSMTGDVVMTTKGTIGRLAFVQDGDPGFVYSPQLCFWRSLDVDVIDPRWLYFAMRSDEMLTQISWSAGQTDMAPYVSLTDQRTAFKITLPSIAEQREIAAVLGALDDKIELNRKTAATLEAMARALYRSWFVDFDPVIAKSEGRVPAHMGDDTAALFPDGFSDDGLPEGWRSGCLGELADNVRVGADPSTIDPETPYIGLEHIPRKSITIGEWGVADDVGSTKTQMRMGQFLFGKLRPYFHKVGLVPVDGICSTDILVIEAKQDQWREFVLSAISSADLVDHVNAASTGTRMPRAKWQDLAAYEIAIPPDAVYQRYSEAVRPMHDRILAQIKESRTLAALRDTLLPQLMSDELRVPAAREIVEETV